MSSLRPPAIRRWLQISDAYFVHLLLRYLPHEAIKWIQIWRIGRPQWRWNQFWNYSLTTQWYSKLHKVVLRHYSGHRRRGKSLHHFAANLFRKLCTKFYQNSPLFRGYYKNTLIFFSGYTVLLVVLVCSVACTARMWSNVLPLNNQCTPLWYTLLNQGKNSRQTAVHSENVALQSPAGDRQLRAFTGA